MSVGLTGGRSVRGTSLPEETMPRPSGRDFGRGDPDVRVGCVFDLRGEHEVLLRGGQAVEHGVAGHKGGGAERDAEGVIAAVVVEKGLRSSSWDFHSEQRRHEWWVELSVQGSIDMPTVETCKVEVLVLWNDSLMERAVMRMLERDVLQALVLWDEAVANYLHLRLVRDCLEIRMQNRSFCIEGLPMAV